MPSNLLLLHIIYYTLAPSACPSITVPSDRYKSSLDRMDLSTACQTFYSMLFQNADFIQVQYPQAIFENLDVVLELAIKSSVTLIYTSACKC